MRAATPEAICSPSSDTPRGRTRPDPRCCRQSQPEPARRAGGIAHNRIGIALAIALQLVNGGVIRARCCVGEAEPVERVIGQQRIGRGLAEPDASFREMVAVEVVVAECQSGAWAKGGLALLIGEQGERLVHRAGWLIVQGAG